MKNIIGLMLVDAPHSALNNAGADIGSRTENTVIVKKIRKNGKDYPYVSAQALRYWWRETLKERFKWDISPVERDKKVAFTKANPFKFDDDDMFGYMRAQSAKAGGTVTRISPLKCSPLLSVIPVKLVDDFGVMARQDGDPAPYEHQFYSTVMKGVFSIDVNSVGRFSMINRSGYKNITDKMKKEWEEVGAVLGNDNTVEMPEKIRKKRIEDTISALAYIYGGAKQTLHLTDVTPKLIILAEINGGNHIFMNIVDEENGKLKINLEALEEVLKDYDADILTNVYIGKRKGFLDELENEIKSFINKIEEDRAFSKEIKFGSINEVIANFIKEIVL